MRWTHQILLSATALALACSFINKFDDVGEILPDGGAGSSGDGGTGGGATGGTGGSAGTGNTGNEAGAGGDGGPDIPLVGAIVVGQRLGEGTAAKNQIVVIDPADGTEVRRTETDLEIQAIGYEAPRDKWFIFTGTAGAGGPSTVLVGTVTRRGFVQESESVVTDGKPTGQSTLTVLNQRVLYRTVQSNGTSTLDKLVLLDTTDLTDLSLRGSVDIPVANRIFTTLGRPAPTTAGGRVTFIHYNRNDSSACMVPDGGTQSVCPVKTSSILIQPTANNPAQPPTPQHVDWIGQSGSNPSGATDLKNGFDYIVVPPEPTEGSTATIFKFDSDSMKQAEVNLDLGAVGASTLSTSSTIVDPCTERVVTSEHSNTKKLYAVSLTGGGTPATVTINGEVGGLVYEPYTKTVIQFFQNPSDPAFRGFVLGGTAQAPTLTERGTASGLPWTPPADLNPKIVVVKFPLQPPCN